MPTLYLEWGQDFLVNESGGLVTAVGWDEERQSIERFLLTNCADTDIFGNYEPADYIFHTDYGLSLPRFEGRLAQQSVIDAMIAKAMNAVLSNPAVVKTPPPIVAIVEQEHTLQVLIDVTLANNEPGSIAIEVSK